MTNLSNKFTFYGTKIVMRMNLYKYVVKQHKFVTFDFVKIHYNLITYSEFSHLFSIHYI